MWWNGLWGGGGWPWGWWMAAHGFFSLLFLAFFIGAAVVLSRSLQGRETRGSRSMFLRKGMRAARSTVRNIWRKKTTSAVLARALKIIAYLHIREAEK